MASTTVQQQQQQLNYSHLMPLGNVEIFGKLRGFDDYVNMILDDVTEIITAADTTTIVNKLESILLNGTNVCLIIPGGIHCASEKVQKLLK